jgi:LysM repeat protein
VFDQEAAVAPASETSFFIVQQSDTLDNIAVITNSNVPAIQAANPGLGPVVLPGQVIAIPPHPPLPAPPAQPGQQPVHPPLPVPPAQPVQMGTLPPSQPGQPVQIPGLAGLFGGQMAGIAPNQPGGGGGGQASMIQPVQPGQVQVMPSFFPAGNAANPPNSPLKAPQGLTAKADGCIVSLSWNPQGTNAKGFAIYHRQKGDPRAVLLKTIEGTVLFTPDQAPYATIYEYAVESVMKRPQQVGQIINLLKTARSGYVQVEAKVSPNCIEDPKGVRYLYFQITNVTAKADLVSLPYSVDDGVARRIPKVQHNFHIPGDWVMQPEILPIPASIYQNPNSLII